MSKEEGLAFEATGVAKESVKMRMWDEAAKEVEGVVYPPIAKYRSLILYILYISILFFIDCFYYSTK